MPYGISHPTEVRIPPTSTYFDNFWKH